MLMNSGVVRIIINHGLDTIFFCLERVSSLIRRKPFLLKGIKLGKIIYVLGNNEVLPEAPQSKGNRFHVGAEIVLTDLLVSQKKGKTIAC